MTNDVVTAGPWGGGGARYSAELGEAVCGRVAAGESLRGICGGPGMPCRKTLRAWAEAYPAFGAALAAAQRAARTQARLRDRAARRGISVRGGRAASTYTDAMGTEICRRLAEGESLIAICRTPGMPRQGKVYDWVKANPGFEAMYVEARQRQADSHMDEVREVGLAATPGTVWADRLRFDTLRWLTARLAPKKYCEKIMVLEAMKAEAEPGAMTVIVKRYADITPEEYARAAEGEP